MQASTPITEHFVIHDHTLRLVTDHAYIRSCIRESLACFSGDPRSAAPVLTVSLFACERGGVPRGFIPPDVRLLYTPSERDMFDISLFGVRTFDLYMDPEGDAYYLDVGSVGCLSYTPARCRAEGYLVDPESIPPRVLSVTLFMFLLDRLLQARGLFATHCSAVEKEGKGLIFPGFSGSGKTTACIALIRAGFGFLGDDRPFLRYDGGGNLELLAFPERIDVTDETLNFFPELREGGFLEAHRNQTKKSFRADTAYPGCVRDACVPRIILYPEIAEGRESRLEDLPRSEALKSLLPHGLLVFDKRASRKHFELLCDLVESTDCYRLRFGADVAALPRLVASVL